MHTCAHPQSNTCTHPHHLNAQPPPRGSLSSPPLAPYQEKQEKKPPCALLHAPPPHSYICPHDVLASIKSAAVRGMNIPYGSHRQRKHAFSNNPPSIIAHTLMPHKITDTHTQAATSRKKPATQHTHQTPSHKMEDDLRNLSLSTSSADVSMPGGEHNIDADEAEKMKVSI